MIINSKLSRGLAVFMACMICFTGSVASAVERPSPEAFSEEIGLFWYEEKYEELEARVDEVYGAHPDFIPAIIAASFVDGVFLGRIYDSREKLILVKEHIDEDPEEFDHIFVLGVNALMEMADREIETQEAAGRTPEELEENASPAAVREAFGPALIPFVSVLAFAPDTEIPDAPD